MDDVYYYENLTAIMEDLSSSSSSDYIVYTINQITDFPNKEDYTVDTSYLESYVSLC